ncbi:MAG: hypothetical protein GYB68_19585 [Chloroflexi bacterium]|nr:hypothetical protein [Chloroflexota bacterium]
MMKEHPDQDAFNQVVWSIVQQVPIGQVTTYGQIASMIPAPDHPDLSPGDYRRLAAFWVGKAMTRAKQEDQLPWQRVVGKGGKIAMPTRSWGAAEQRRRLINEGVVFSADETIDLERFGWEGPPADWLATEGLLQPTPLIDKPDDRPQQLSLL